MADAPKPARQARRHPLRLLHLMALVVMVALTLIVPPALMPLLRSVASWADGTERLIDEISLALTLWTPILALVAVFGDRSQLRRTSRSYGISAVLAVAAALFLLLLRNLFYAFLQYRRGNPFFPEGGYRGGGYFCPAAAQLVLEAPGVAAAVIIAVWSILALTRAGRGPSDYWFERFCLLFGLFWVLWYFGRDFMLLSRW
jgi:hypothetical protein